MTTNGSEEINQPKDNVAKSEKSQDDFSSRAMNEVMTEFKNGSATRNEAPATASGSDGFSIVDSKNQDNKEIGSKQAEKDFGPKQAEKEIGSKQAERDFGPKQAEKEIGSKQAEKEFGPKQVEKEFGPKEAEKDFGPKEVEKSFGPKETEKDFGPKDLGDKVPGDKDKSGFPDLGGDGIPPEEQWHAAHRAAMGAAMSLMSNGGFGNTKEERANVQNPLQQIADLLPVGGAAATIQMMNDMLESVGADYRLEMDLGRQTGPDHLPLNILGHETSVALIRRGDPRAQYLFRKNSR